MRRVETADNLDSPLSYGPDKQDCPVRVVLGLYDLMPTSTATIKEHHAFLRDEVNHDFKSMFVVCEPLAGPKNR